MREKTARKLIEKVKKSYDTIADEFDRTRSHPGKEFAFFNKYLTYGETIVDIGCGNGRLVPYLEELFSCRKVDGAENDNFKYIGIDSNSSLLNKAGERLAKPGKIIFFPGDQLEIPLESNSTDVAFNIRAFHHIPSRKKRICALSEIYRILRPGGYAIITVWNLWQGKYLRYMFFALLRFLFTLGAYAPNDALIPWGKKVKRYYHGFLPFELSSLFKKTSLVIEDMIYAKKDLRVSFLNCHDIIIVARKCQK